MGTTTTAVKISGMLIGMVGVATLALGLTAGIGTDDTHWGRGAIVVTADGTTPATPPTPPTGGNHPDDTHWG